MRRPMVQDLSRRTHCNKPDTTKQPPIVSEGRQNTAAAHSSGRSRVQIANLAISPYTWSHVLSWRRYRGKHLANSN
jgi:hypothetical protein